MWPLLFHSSFPSSSTLSLPTSFPSA
jgi:hypothetical protein